MLNNIKLHHCGRSIGHLSLSNFINTQKSIAEMKTFKQLSEDLKAQARRSAAIRQATLDKHQQRVSAYKERIQAQKDKEEEHQEIVKKVKRELG